MNCDQPAIQGFPSRSTAISSIGSGQLITRFGRYRPFPIAGTAIMTVGMILLSLLHVHTSTWTAMAYAAVLGLGPGNGNADQATGEITLPVGTDGTSILTEAVRRLDDARVKLADVALRRPSLDDVFLALTGHAAEERDDGQPEAGAEPRRGGGRG